MTPPTPGGRWARAVAVVALGFGVAYLGLRVASAAWWLSFVPFTGEILVLGLWRRWQVPLSDLLTVAVPVGLALGVGSIVTGFENGLTDEPWAFPLEQSMLFHGIDPYAVLHVAVNPYSHTATPGRLWELPLTVVLLIPRVPYGYQMLGCWTALVVLLRKHEAGALLAQPFVALLAANGFSDFLPLLLLTAAYLGPPVLRSRWTEALALGVKQFANVVVAVRYLWRREWRNLLRVAVITAAWTVPFLLWDAKAFTCGAIVFDVPSGCPPNANLAGPHAIDPLSLNYWLWPLWAVPLGWSYLPRAIRRFLERTFRWAVRA